MRYTSSPKNGSSWFSIKASKGFPIVHKRDPLPEPQTSELHALLKPRALQDGPAVARQRKSTVETDGFIVG